MRREKIVKIASDDPANRDAGKSFRIVEMSAVQADDWGIRALAALARSGADMPDDIAGAGLAGVATFAFRAVSGMAYLDMKPLLAEMMTCVEIMPDPRHPEVKRVLVEGDIEEVSTLWYLRGEVFELHTGFSVAAYLSEARDRFTSRLAAEPSPDSSNIGTSPPV